MKTLTVADAMTPDPVSVPPEMEVGDVAKVMVDKGIGGVPVVTTDGDLVGIVTESDLIVLDSEVKFPSYVHFLDGYIFVPGAVHKFEEKFRKAVAATAGEMMTEDVLTVAPDDKIEDVAELMTKKKMKRFPVVQDGALVGIITMRDIVKLISKDTPVEA
jgi:CBS domain-containing protein